MIPRLCNLSKSRSFFLFGPRGVGKSTLLRSHFGDIPAYYVNLLDSETERRLATKPERILEEWRLQPEVVKKSKWIIVDEVQRIPKILDAAHLGIESLSLRFALTGSSARKLRRGSANLLAGRASEFRLHPFCFLEIENQFNTDDVLAWGSMPTSLQLRDDLVERRRYLNAYVNTYLREEIQAEQIVRNMEPFRMFLEVAASANGKILNVSKLARQSNIDPKSAQRYFEILADTLLGFFLPAFNLSVRKQQSSHAKFYFFDIGVCRAAAGQLTADLRPSTFSYGDVFEHLVILEAWRLNDVLERDFRFSYLPSEEGTEVDLIIKRPNGFDLLEIKSTDNPDVSEIKKIKNVAEKFPKKATPYILCQTKVAHLADGVQVMPWQEGLKKIFG